jgi:predicted enzyme related to lactoylglutathione lyase
MTGNPVGWFEIYVQDMARAQAFYESMLQVQLNKLPNNDYDLMAFPSDMTTYGAGGALVKMDGMPSGGNSTLVYFSCTDCGPVAMRAAASGGTIFRNKFSIGEYGFIALCTDTEGNMFGLHSMQ